MAFGSSVCLFLNLQIASMFSWETFQYSRPSSFVVQISEHFTDSFNLHKGRTFHSKTNIMFSNYIFFCFVFFTNLTVRLRAEIKMYHQYYYYCKYEIRCKTLLVGDLSTKIEAESRKITWGVHGATGDATAVLPRLILASKAFSVVHKDAYPCKFWNKTWPICCFWLKMTEKSLNSVSPFLSLIST